jgi:hypothetical protein
MNKRLFTLIRCKMEVLQFYLFLLFIQIFFLVFFVFFVQFKNIFTQNVTLYSNNRKEELYCRVYERILKNKNATTAQLKRLIKCLLDNTEEV